eukprot:TRINITY_DN3006_c0_g1_i4.p1 TRINITY_DN3006_c0_g1~~TRINITY_DN3006_c0_g1_i4.p1  ORF type:complete len:709 (-),score=155.44 TRINITY_DN3006_c0_g1_i4:108-2234(-)
MAFVYPETPRGSVVDQLHGQDVADPYRHLEDPDSESTKAWVDEQNKVTDEFMKNCTDKPKIRQRLEHLMNYPRVGCPFKRGGKYYFYKNTGLQNQSILYVQDTLDSTEPKVFLDPNTLSEDGTAALGVTKFSDSGDYFAYGVSLSGSDWQTIYVRNTNTFENLADKLQWIKFSSIAWAPDNSGFYYSRFPAPASRLDQDEEKRGSEVDQNINNAVYFHKLNTPQEEDTLIYRDPGHPKWIYSVSTSNDSKYLLITSSESTAPVNRVFYLKFDAVEKDSDGLHKVTKLIDNFDAGYSYITNQGSKFYFHSNRNAPKYRILSIDLERPEEENWTEVIPQTNDPMEWAFCVNHDNILVMYMRDVKEILELKALDGSHLHTFDLPSFGSIIEASGKHNETEMTFKFASFLYPGSVFHYDFKTKTQTLWFESKVQGFEPSLYTVNQVFYESTGGDKIPMYIIHKKGIALDGNRMTFLYGYGGFSISLTPAFSTNRLVFLQHYDGVLAIPNLRGGGEYGEEWHEKGILDRKQNVFDDFQNAAKYLIEHQYTRPERLAICGGSNGGLLVGACVNQRPDLFGCAIAQVGVLDMLRFHKFTIGHFWVSDYGCADKAEDFEYLIKYSPLHTVKKGRPFPSVLLTTADHDDRVVPLHSYKYISTLQFELGKEAYQTKPLLIRVETKTGHGAGKPISKVLDETAEIYSFVTHCTGSQWLD